MMEGIISNGSAQGLPPAPPPKSTENPPAPPPPPPEDSAAPPPPPDDVPAPPPPPADEDELQPAPPLEAKKKKKQGWGAKKPASTPLSVEELVRKKREADAVAAKVSWTDISVLCFVLF